MVMCVVVLLLLMRWWAGIGQLVVTIQEGLTVSAGNGADGGVHPGAGRGGGVRGGARARW